MKEWVNRFFTLNKEIEVEITERVAEQISRASTQLGWVVDDELWVPDLHVIRLIKGKNELFLIRETFFGPKLTGNLVEIELLQAAAEKFDSNGEVDRES